MAACCACGTSVSPCGWVIHINRFIIETCMCLSRGTRQHDGNAASNSKHSNKVAATSATMPNSRPHPPSHLTSSVMILTARAGPAGVGAGGGAAGSCSTPTKRCLQASADGTGIQLLQLTYVHHLLLGQRSTTIHHNSDEHKQEPSQQHMAVILAAVACCRTVSGLT